jgi:Uma2 family endonuclease
MGVVTLLTEEQFLNLPDEPGKRELIDGEVIALPPAKHFHGILAKRFVHLLESPLDPSRVWRDEPYHLRKGRCLIPDVSVSWPDQPIQDDWFQGAPTVAIEIASRGNTADEIDRKVAVYLEHGAAEVWVLYPKTNRMIVFRKDSADQIAAGSDYRCNLLGVTVSATDRKPA